MQNRETSYRMLGAVAAIALAIGTASWASAETMTETLPQATATAGTGGTAGTSGGLERYGDSASLSSGAPITAPSTVDGGQPVSISVSGAHEGARVQLWGPIGENTPPTELESASLSGGTATLTAPDMPGSYQLRYLDSGGKVLGRRALDVAAIPVVLQVQTPVSPGGALEVQWQGPARPGDRFEIVSDTGGVAESTPVAGDRAGVNLSQIAPPEVPGSYELRYVTSGGAVLRSVRFEVR
ncbi:MAG TPA: hypothetical protein VK090_05250 [Paracoccaceae bacterium]|nr:hypothetical protein [Paracoccaceae bacterium]